MTDKGNLFQNLIHFRGFGFFCCFGNGNNTEFRCTAAVFYLDNVADLNVIGRLYDLAVYRNKAFAARFVCNCATLDYARYFKIFI